MCTKICMCTKIHAYTGQNETSEAPAWPCASIGMKKYTACSFSYFFNAVLLLAWHPSDYWAILSPAHEHMYICICTQETALAEDWIGFMNQWPCGSFSDTEAEDASFPPCHCDTPRDLCVSGREKYWSNLLKDSCKLWLIAWNFTSSKHAQLEITATHKELEDVQQEGTSALSPVVSYHR